VLVMLVLATGFLVADIIAADLPKLAEPGRLVFAPKGIVLHIGGHPANVSINLVKLGLNPKDICVVGAVGNDVFGDFIENVLKSYNLVVRLHRVKNVGTTKNMILVVKGEDRRFHVDLGASWFLDPDEIISSLKELRPKIAYFATGITGRLDDKLGEVVRKAKALGCMTFVDVIQPYGKGWEYVLPALPHADIFHCNDIELSDIMGEKELTNGIRKVLKLGTKLVLITMGDRGANVANGKILVRQPSYKVDVVDPTGAGDAFCAGVLHHLMTTYGEKLSADLLSKLGKDELSKLLLWAQAVGAIKCTGPGTTTAVSYEGAMSLMKAQGKRLLKETISQRL